MNDIIAKEFKELLITFKDLYVDYEKREKEAEAENESPKIIGIRKGKKEAYGYASKKLEDLMKWHGIINNELE